MSSVSDLSHTPVDTSVGARVVTAAEITAYREVVRSGVAQLSSGRRGTVASPVHPFVLVWAALAETLAAEVDGVAPAIVHLSQEITQERPLSAGEPMSVKLGLVGARKEPRGVRVALRTAIAGADGTSIAELLTGLLLVGAAAPAPFGHVPAHPAGEPSAWASTVRRSVPQDLPRRYAEVSGDDNPIHLDGERARAAGFPGVIAHGMCVMAMVCEEVVARFGAGDAARVRRVGGRFSSPVLPGEPLDICLAPEAGTGLVRFGCKTPHGTAIKGGWVELAGHGRWP